MERFLTRHEDRIEGIISGFDRILFRGSLRSICYPNGILIWIRSMRLRFVDFGAFAQQLTNKIKQEAILLAERHDRPYEHVYSPRASKEAIALRIAKQKRVQEGLICVLSCVEPSRSYRLALVDGKKKHVGLKLVDRNCLHLYFYYLDREFGLMHVRLQTWLPFTIQVCVNGWEWLARRLDEEGIGYEKYDNCFAKIADFARAQELMDQLTTRNWGKWLNRWARETNPWMRPHHLRKLKLRRYYWSVRESELSTDVIFKGRKILKETYPRLLRYAIEHLGTEDVLRFLQKRLTKRFAGEAMTHAGRRVEGIRIRHQVQENSIKMYDKQGRVLRVETTINNPRRWRVHRRLIRNGTTCIRRIPMRKGIADIRKRAQVSRTANHRYLDALSVVGETLPTRSLTDRVSQRLKIKGRPYRAIHPISPQDAPLLQTISRGHFLIHGFRNKDLRLALDPTSDRNPVARKSAASRISRLLTLLRLHRIVYRIRGTHNYRLTNFGRRVTSAALMMRTMTLAAIAT